MKTAEITYYQIISGRTDMCERAELDHALGAGADGGAARVSRAPPVCSRCPLFFYWQPPKRRSLRLRNLHYPMVI
jgi:hypothetical protein